MKKAKGKEHTQEGFWGLVAGVYAPLRDTSLRTRADPPLGSAVCQGVRPLGTPYSRAINYP